MKEIIGEGNKTSFLIKLIFDFPSTFLKNDFTFFQVVTFSKKALKSPKSKKKLFIKVRQKSNNIIFVPESVLKFAYTIFKLLKIFYSKIYKLIIIIQKHNFVLCLKFL